MDLKKITPAWVTEFKEFALKGNVVDMAIGVIIGGAFGKIVTSLVGDVIMPAFGMLFGSTAAIAELQYAPFGTEEGAPILKYGLFIQSIVDFILIALTIFFAIRLICKLRAKFKKEEAEAKEEAPAPAEPAPTPEEILLLREIRDSLKK